MSEAQASQALDPVLKQISGTTDQRDPVALHTPADALQALAPTLSKAQATQALDTVLKQIGPTPDPVFFLALVDTLQTLPLKLSEAQVSQVLDPMLKQVGQTTDPNTLQTLAPALRMLADKLSEAQASQALDLMLTVIGQTTNTNALLSLAQVLQSLPVNLSEAEAMQASEAAAASLAWAGTDEEASEWARALIKLSRSAANREEMLVERNRLPCRGRIADRDLARRIRAGHPDAPTKEAGTEAALDWLARTFPDILRPPLCPRPLQPGLKCPPSARQ